jgi:glycosyltransferase involved in cell wall biosynthesis
MRVLFLHPNFPGQFQVSAAHLAARGHEVVSLCQTHYGRLLPGVRRVRLKGHLGNEVLDDRKMSPLHRSLALAEQFLRGMRTLESQGFQPDVVVSHSGWGCGLHTGLVWPSARRVAYVEWWFADDAELLRFDPDDPWLGLHGGKALGLRQRNLPLALELVEAHRLIAPTAWQRRQLPPSLRERCAVLPDGVDLRRFRPARQPRQGAPLLTYGTRGMEAMRGFPQFIRELPAVLGRWGELTVEIAGEDRISYGGKAPKDGFRAWAEAQLGPWLATGRVRFLGRLAPPHYERWLRRTWVHVYLTAPYVLSWSLLEAMASGACLVASDVAPVREFLDGHCARLVDHRRPGWLESVLPPLLENQEAALAMGRHARLRSLAVAREAAAAAWERELVEEVPTHG